MVLSRRKKRSNRRTKLKSRRYHKKMGGGAPLKVAMFFAGRVTAYQHVLPKLLEIKNTYNPVIFCSINKESGDADDIDSFCKELEIPVKQRIIEEIVFPEWVDKCWMHRQINHKGMYSMFYNQHKAFDLVEQYQTKNSMEFDCVLYYRADMDSKDKLFLKLPKPNTVYIAGNRGYNGYNDRLAYGNYESMKVYCNVISQLEKLFCENNDPFINQEMILKQYLTNAELKISFFPYNTDLHPLRNKKYILEANPAQ